MKVALAQMDIVWEDKEKNWEKSEKNIKEAKKKGADLILFPEMSFTGFSMNVAEIGETKEKGNSVESIRRMQSFAKKYEMAVGFGYVERDGDMGKNHYAVVDEEGKVLGDYIKIHPFSYGGEDKYYQPGEYTILFEVKGWKMAMFICYDLRFPEIFSLVSDEAEAIIVAANWPESRREHWMALLKARAIENQCYVLGVNRTGMGGGISYTGDSMVVDPYGNVIGRMEKTEGMLLCEIEKRYVEEWRATFPQKNDRKKNYAFYQTR
ncbi:MAG: carbon-nitrogen family hydrolase [Lachnospiraceae bacterium]|nr:carbon-nitrogen family hydrolase [Robinsoniella sp.]MDY3766636.1 carbon-nitrogen family hydrolase [Lachnospiraceae bacterium]